MPRPTKKVTKFTPKRKPYFNKGYRNQPISPSYNRLPLGGFPLAQTVKLRYCEQIAIDVDQIAGVEHFRYRANSMYDPNFTGIGHQPRGFDQWMAVYDHYRVIQSHITVTPTTNTYVNLTPGMFEIILCDDTITPITNYKDLFENFSSNGKPLLYGPENNFNSQSQCKSKVYKQAAYFRNNANNSRFIGTATSSPSEIAVFDIVCTSIGGNDPTAFQFFVCIDFIAELTERKPLPES